MRTCVHTYIRTYVHTYIRTYVRTYIHMNGHGSAPVSAHITKRVQVLHAPAADPDAPPFCSPLPQELDCAMRFGTPMPAGSPANCKRPSVQPKSKCHPGGWVGSLRAKRSHRVHMRLHEIPSVLTGRHAKSSHGFTSVARAKMPIQMCSSFMSGDAATY